MKKFLIFLFVIGMGNVFISMNNPDSESAKPFTVVEREPVVLDMPTAKEGEYEFTEEDFLGDWITADGSSDIRFYKYNGQIYYAAYYNGTYYEGFAVAYPTHGAIYCIDGYVTDGNVAISFYYGYDGDMIMYDQVYGTEYYLKTSY